MRNLIGKPTFPKPAKSLLLAAVVLKCKITSFFGSLFCQRHATTTNQDQYHFHDKNKLRSQQEQVFFILCCDIMPETQGSTVGLSEAEAAIYDRQIRLWGLDAQHRFEPVLMEVKQ
jgi:hypothetical protein